MLKGRLRRRESWAETRKKNGAREVALKGQKKKTTEMSKSQ